MRTFEAAAGNQLCHVTIEERPSTRTALGEMRFVATPFVFAKGKRFEICAF